MPMTSGMVIGGRLTRKRRPNPKYLSESSSSSDDESVPSPSQSRRVATAKHRRDGRTTAPFIPQKQPVKTKKKAPICNSKPSAPTSPRRRSAQELDIPEIAVANKEKLHLIKEKKKHAEMQFLLEEQVSYIKNEAAHL